MKNINFYTDYFKVDTNIINKVISVALSKGGDFCDLYFQYSESNSLTLEDGVVNKTFAEIDIGVGIRVLKGEQTGFSYTEVLTLESMVKAARMAASIASTSKNIKPIKFKEISPTKYYSEKVRISGVSKKVKLLRELNDKIFSIDKRVVKSSSNIADSTTVILYANSEGVIVGDIRPMARLMSNVIAEDSNKREQNRFDLSGRYGIDYFSEEKLDYIATNAVNSTIELFDAQPIKGGTMEVVLAAGSSGILLHEAIGHGLEADFNKKGSSIFANKMGQRVAKEFVSIVDDGTNNMSRGAINIDDEGVLSQKTFLVRNGILESYLHDRQTAKFYKVKPTGNGRRESFRHLPMPRMRNTYMQPGLNTSEDLIKSVKKGILVETFTNGQVLIGGGDFTFYVKSGYYIENGEKKHPIKDVNIIGNGPQVLSDIVMVANDLKMTEGGWTCGKDGQSVPVSMGLPTTKISKLVVGGN